VRQQSFKAGYPFGFPAFFSVPRMAHHSTVQVRYGDWQLPTISSRSVKHVNLPSE